MLYFLIYHFLILEHPVDHLYSRPADILADPPASAFLNTGNNFKTFIFFVLTVF